LFFALSISGRAADYSDRYDASFERWGRFYMPWQPWQYLKAQGIAESNLEPLAVSPAGAVGLMQFMPATAKEFGVNPLDPESSIQGAAKLDRALQGQFAGPDQRDLALAAYNAGPGSIARAIVIAGSKVWKSVAAVLVQVTGKHTAETLAYVARVEAVAAELQ
jgi:soluble lytic murein transglycosylase-like protein